MRKTLLFLSFFSLIVFLSQPFEAQAKAKGIWDELFSPKVEIDQRKYLMDGKTPHNSQWHARWNPEHEWTPQSWIMAEGSAEAVLDNFYRMGLIKEQGQDGDIPLLVVGDSYMNLSGQEKRRVAEFVDYVYGVTDRDHNAFFYVYYDRTKSWFSRGEPIGVYTENGLQLQ